MSVRIYTIGHSTHSPQHFWQLLHQHEVEVLIDTRSQPFSKIAPQFNRDILSTMACGERIQYFFFGHTLGGRPADESFYDEKGHVLYGRVADSPPFRATIEQMLDGARDHRIALLCSEENPATCHRRLLIGRVLQQHGAEMMHIRGDGRLQTEEQLKRELEQKDPSLAQGMLFAAEEVEEWKSTRSVLDKRPRQSFSARSDDTALSDSLTYD